METDEAESLQATAMAKTDASLGDTMVAANVSITQGDAAPVSPALGERIGRYVILDKLGAGAMGVVLAAYDPELDRKVALKLIESRSAGLASARRRLQREAQALAQLGHPNVVAVHDVGMHEGQLFVGMEFVAGGTMGDWMGEVDSPRPWREVLPVFMDAGRGLAAAHAAGLVHRDFKPDNVMIGDDGRVRVMDFGLARAEGDELDEREGERGAKQAEARLGRSVGDQLLASPMTRTGAVMGTPAYMSKEQFEGKAADARSDQFGFCVALYEALYGQRPFRGASMAELVHAVCEGEIAAAPRTTTVPTWLRRVVVRGLAVEADDRWPSMQELLDALADDPAVRRRQWVVGGALVATMLGGAWGLSQAAMTPAEDQTCAGMRGHLDGVWDDARRAEVRGAFEGTELSYAGETIELVEAQLDAYVDAWVEARQGACEATQKGEQSGELLDQRMACYDERLRHVAASVEIFAAADATVVENAVESLAKLPSLERCRDAAALAADPLAPTNEAVAAEVAALDEKLVTVKARKRTGLFGSGLELAREVAEAAAGLGHEPFEAEAQLILGGLEVDNGEHEAAAAALGQAFDKGLGLGLTTVAADAAAQLVFVVGVRQAKYDEGRHWARVAAPLARASGSQTVEANFNNSMGLIADNQADYAGARVHLERAIELWTASLGRQSGSVAGALTNLGTVAQHEGKYGEARRYQEQSLEIVETTLGAGHPDVAYALTNLGGVAILQGELDDARDYQTRALAAWREALGPKHPNVGGTLVNLGITASKQGNYDEARGYQEEALALFEDVVGPDHPNVAYALVSLGTLTSSQGDYEASRGYYERALKIWQTKLGPEHPNVAVTLGNLGTVAHKEGQLEAAAEYYERSLAVRESTQTAEHPGVAKTLTRYAQVLLDMDAAARALPMLERAHAIQTKGESDAIELAETEFVFARALWAVGSERERAKALLVSSRARYAELGERATDSLADLDAWAKAEGLSSTE